MGKDNEEETEVGGEILLILWEMEDFAGVEDLIGCCWIEFDDLDERPYDKLGLEDFTVFGGDDWGDFFQEFLPFLSRHGLQFRVQFWAQIFYQLWHQLRPQV